MADRFCSTLYFDSNGVLTEHRWVDGMEIVVHYDDIPPQDQTVVDGIPCTTPLRTVIDLAADLDTDDLVRIVEQCLDTAMFTIDEGLARTSDPDLCKRRGARILHDLLLEYEEIDADEDD